LYEFGPFRLYPDQKLLFRQDERLDLDRKALVTKGRLLNEVWGGVTVEEGNIGVQLSKVRKALGDDRKQAQFIETVHGEGYRFIANVTERQEELYPDEPKSLRHWRFAVPMLLLLVAAVALLWNFERRRSQIGHEFTPSTLSADARSRYELAQKYESEGDDEQALATLNEATAIDANFADAYLKAASIANQIGNEDQALEYLNRAKSCSGKRDEHQRLQIEALEAELTANRQEAMSKYRLLVDSYPTDVAAQYYYADFAMQNRSGFEEAREALEQCLKLDPANRYCEFDRMMLYVLTGDFDKTIALYRSLTPTAHYPWFEEPFGLALYGKGDLAGARNALGNFSRGTRTHGLTKFTTGREWLADINFFEGKIAEASSEIEVLLASDSRYGVSTHYLYLANVNVLLSNSADARTLALKALSGLDDKDTRLEAAAILACAGYSEDSEHILRFPNGQSITNISAGTKTFIDGCKALTLGDHTTAIREFQASYDIDDDLESQFFLGKAHLAARRWEDAKAIFKDLVASKGRIITNQAYPPVIWPLAHYYLAIAYEESGERAEAISYYSKFLDHWNGGDRNLKATFDATERLGRLQSSPTLKGSSQSTR
jgi:tetratricopeptide (TPR) repeat protein